ncbi:hypothetical protein GCM10020331_102620 [Ectobacillus funiculus]
MLCKEIAKEHTGTYSFLRPKLCICRSFLYLVDSRGLDSVSSLVEKIQQKRKKTFLNLETAIGIGNAVTGLAELKKNGYISSLLSWSQSQLGSKSQVIDATVMKEELFKFSPDLEKKVNKCD